MSQIVYDISELAKAKVLLDATQCALKTPKKRYQFSEFCAVHNFPTFSSVGRNNQEYKNLNGEWHILLRRYTDKADLCKYLEARIQSLTKTELSEVPSEPIVSADYVAVPVVGSQDCVEPNLPEKHHGDKQQYSGFYIPLLSFASLYLIRMCFISTV